MKRKLFTALSLLLSVSLLCACGRSATDAASQDDTKSVSTSEIDAFDDVASDDVSLENSQEDTLSFTPVTLLENDSCRIIAKGIVPTGSWGYTVQVILENFTDTDLMFAIDRAAVNGVMSDPFWAAMVEAGTTLENEIAWSSSALAKIGVTTVTDLTLYFTVYDQNDYSQVLLSDSCHVYPHGEEAAAPTLREQAAGDLVLVENDYCTVMVIGLEESGEDSFSILFYLRNNTDGTLMYSLSDSRCNDIAVDAFWAEIVSPSSACYSTATWKKSDLKAAGIEEVHTMDFQLKAYDKDNWNLEDYVNQAFSIHVDNFR